jgi:hypothetical protein
MLLADENKAGANSDLQGEHQGGKCLGIYYGVFAA